MLRASLYCYSTGQNYWANNSHKLDLEVAALLRLFYVFTESGPRPPTLKTIFEVMTIKLSTEMKVPLKIETFGKTGRM
jgi:hypothetical protein